MEPNLATSCEEVTHWKRSYAGRDWGQEEKGMTEDEMAGITNSMGMSLSKLQEFMMDRGPGVLQFMGSQIAGHN